jgi:hypothetical protein
MEKKFYSNGKWAKSSRKMHDVVEGIEKEVATAKEE